MGRNMAPRGRSRLLVQLDEGQKTAPLKRG